MEIFKIFSNFTRMKRNNLKTQKKKSLFKDKFRSFQDNNKGETQDGL